MPTLDNLIADLNGSKVFNKLNISGAYHQLELAEETRYITTFSTHVGLRRYKLLFGVNSASEIFQNAIAEILQDVPGSSNISDDIVVHGKTQEEHEESLRATLKRLHDRGAKLNKDKCVFSVPTITFFGHVFGQEGVSPDPDKSVAPLIPMECGHSSDFVLASPCSPRVPVFLVSPYFP